jgi:hypothetical protein
MKANTRYSNKKSNSSAQLGIFDGFFVSKRHCHVLLYFWPPCFPQEHKL